MSRPLSDILSELDKLCQRQGVAPDGTFSTSDLAEQLSVSQVTALSRVHQWHKAGLIETCIVHRKAINGKIMPVTAYRRVKGAKKK